MPTHDMTDEELTRTLSEREQQLTLLREDAGTTFVLASVPPSHFDGLRDAQLSWLFSADLQALLVAVGRAMQLAGPPPTVPVQPGAQAVPGRQISVRFRKRGVRA
jgi:hypothetical protein